MAFQKHFTLAPVTVAAAGTAVPISAVATPAIDIIITADAGNTGTVYVGDSTVDSSNGQPLAAGESYAIGTGGIRGTQEDFVLSDVYVDAATNGDSVRVAYTSRR